MVTGRRAACRSSWHSASLSAALGLGEAAKSGRRAAFNAMAGQKASSTSESEDGSSSMPGWARAMQTQQSARHHRQTALHVIQSGDRGGHGATPDIKERED
jgi:type IV secretion system protein TrbL